LAGRHWFATHFLKSGCLIQTVQDLRGHRSWKTKICSRGSFLGAVCAYRENRQKPPTVWPPGNAQLKNCDISAPQALPALMMPMPIGQCSRKFFQKGLGLRTDLGDDLKFRQAF
jgi:hypothetical protein